jgi:RNA polymerase sigma-70 factor, ECF subfamily
MTCVRDPAAEAADADPVDRAQAVFLGARGRLFGVAYGILHNSYEAEDAVQDAWLRWQATDRAAVVNAEAFLVATTTRLALNNAQSAWHRRETPAGSWLPDHPESELSPEEAGWTIYRVRASPAGQPDCTQVPGRRVPRGIA